MTNQEFEFRKKNNLSGNLQQKKLYNGYCVNIVCLKKIINVY